MAVNPSRRFAPANPVNHADDTAQRGHGTISLLGRDESFNGKPRDEWLADGSCIVMHITAPDMHMSYRRTVRPARYDYVYRS